jgi:hypothetical protein
VIGVHRCSLVVDGREVAAFREATVVGTEVGPPERPSTASGRSCFLVLYAATGAPLAKYQLAKARPTAATVLTCDYIQEMAP